MKRVVLLIICIVGLLFADWVNTHGTSESPMPPDKYVTASGSLAVFIRNVNYGFIREDTTVDLKTFQRIKIPEEALDYDTLNIGKPQIPYIKLLIAVPDSADFDITVYKSDFILFEDYFLYPVPEIVFETDTTGYTYSKEIFTYDEYFYQQDTLYPGKLYEIKKDGHWRDQRILEVYLYPVQFNPQQQVMYFYNSMDLRIEYMGEVIENTTGLGPFEDLGPDILLNYPGDTSGTRSEPEPSVHYYTDLLNTGNVADYIIVSHNDFLNQSEVGGATINTFAWWRVNHNGFDVGIVDMIDIYDQFPDSLPDSATVLKEFLEYAYDNWHAPSMTDDHFAYCLFIGDWDYVPTRLYHHYSLHHHWLVADECYFRNLKEGGLDEIMLGRWPVKADWVPIDLVTIAQKTLDYEQNPDIGDWRRDGLLIAGRNGTAFDEYVKGSVGYFTDISYDTFTVYRSQLETSQQFRDSIRDCLNLGEILTAYFDHGSMIAWDGFDTTHVKALINGSKLPVLLSAACLTGGFQWDHPHYDTAGCPRPGGKCFGEHFLFNPNGGAVAFYGSPRTGGLGGVADIIAQILQKQTWILGKALIPHISYQYCLLGDPALDLGDYTAYPDLPDLVVRPRGIDFSLPTYPYLLGNGSNPFKAEIWNIGGATAYNIEVELRIERGLMILHSETVWIDEIQPQATAEVVTYWEPEGIYGERGDWEFSVRVDLPHMIDESWDGNNYSSIVKRLVLYPNQPGWPKKILGCSQPAIGDVVPVLGLASVEIVCPGLDSVYVFDINGDNLYNWPQYFPGVHSVVLGDINNDTYLEIIAVSLDSVKVYNWEGNILWSQEVFDYPTEPYQIVRPPSLGRIENSSSRYLDIVIIGNNVQGGPLKVIVYDCNGNLQYEYESDLSAMQHPYNNVSPASISDINGDGKTEIIVSAWALPGFTTIFNKDGVVTTLDYGSGLMTPALADVDDDNYPEIISGGRDAIIRAYNAKDDIILWETETGGTINSSPAVGDIHPDLDTLEIVFGNDANEIWAIRDVNGWPWQPWPFETDHWWVRTSAALADIDDNSGLDIIIGAYDRYGQYIYALKHDGLAIPPFPLPLFDQPSSPIIGDIDRDGKSEIILTTDDGYLHVWENMNSSVPILKLEWPQFHHDFQRTGLYGWVDKIPVTPKPKLKVSVQEFSNATTVSCSISTSLQTQITIYNSQGEIVKTLMNQELPAGEYQLDWDGTDDYFDFLPNGSYIIELKTEQGIETIPVEINR